MSCQKRNQTKDVENFKQNLNILSQKFRNIDQRGAKTK